MATDDTATLSSEGPSPRMPRQNSGGFEKPPPHGSRKQRGTRSDDAPGPPGEDSLQSIAGLTSFPPRNEQLSPGSGRPPVRRRSVPLPSSTPPPLTGQGLAGTRSSSLTDVRNQIQPPSKTGTPFSWGLQGPSKLWTGKQEGEKPGDVSKGGMIRKEKEKGGWGGLQKVMSRHTWITDEGEDDKGGKEKRRKGSGGGGQSAGEGNSSMRRASSVRLLRKGSDSDESSRGGGVSARSDGDIEGRKRADLGGRQRPPMVPRPSPSYAAGLDESYRSHYLSQEARDRASGGTSLNGIESLNVPVKIFPVLQREEGGLGGNMSEERRRDGDSQKEGQFTSGTGAWSSGPLLRSISEQTSTDALLHQEIETLGEGFWDGGGKERSEREQRTEVGAADLQARSGGATEARQTSSGKGEGFDRQLEAERDPFDNKANPLPGTEAYGMTQVEDDGGFQDTAQSGGSLGGRFKMA
jgi:hypothetical protein